MASAPARLPWSAVRPASWAREEIAHRRDHRVARDLALAARGEVAHFHHALRQLIAAVDQREFRARLGRGLELLAERDLLQGIFDAITGRAQRLDVAEGREPFLLAA